MYGKHCSLSWIAIKYSTGKSGKLQLPVEGIKGV
jgi:hypothetical protein